jgi:putative phosphoesterase
VKVAAISDVHGNLPALEAVLEAVRDENPDLIVSCGDVASGPMPAETIDLLRTLSGARFVRGNADAGLVDEFDGTTPPPLPGPFADWCARQINRDQRDFLASFEGTVIIDDVDGIGRVLFCHATPRNENDIFTVETPDDQVRGLFGRVDADLVVCGHTHMQFDRKIDGLRVVNAGSVGMPYGRPGAYWTLLGPEVRPKRTDYDREAAAARIRALSWPSADEFAARNVLAAPSVEEAMDVFRKAAARLASAT